MLRSCEIVDGAEGGAPIQYILKAIIGLECLTVCDAELDRSGYQFRPALHRLNRAEGRAMYSTDDEVAVNMYAFAY